MLKKINKLLHTPKWLFAVLVCVLILRIPSFFEPYSYGDEMIYLSLGEAIRQGVPLYSQIHDNKPPLLYVMAAIAGNLFWFKALLTFWHLITVYIFWKLSTILFPSGDHKPRKIKAQIVSTAIFALLTTIPLLEGNIANAELFMIGPTILGFYILLSKDLNFKNIFSSGILFSISTLFKVPAAFDMFAIVFFWLAIEEKLNNKSLAQIARQTLHLFLGFLTPIALTFLWYAAQGSFNEYLVAAFLQNIGYLSTWRPDDVAKPFLEKNGPLLLRAIIVAIGFLILFWKKSKISKQFIFLSGWLILTLFATTLSERPYPHYLIQSVPPISFLLGILFTFQNLEQSLAIAPLALALFVPFYFKFWHYPTIPYYSRFIKFAFGQTDKNAYLSLYGQHVPRNYKIANYIVSSTKRKEKIFIWGDGSAIYALSRRLPAGKYVADYHIKDFSSSKETISVLKKELPSFVIVLPDSPAFPNLDSFLMKNYGLVETIEKAEIWKLLNPNIRALIFTNH